MGENGGDEGEKAGEKEGANKTTRGVNQGAFEKDEEAGGAGEEERGHLMHVAAVYASLSSLLRVGTVGAIVTMGHVAVGAIVIVGHAAVGAIVTVGHAAVGVISHPCHGVKVVCEVSRCLNCGMREKREEGTVWLDQVVGIETVMCRCSMKRG